MITFLALLLGKCIFFLSRSFKRGSGSTWPGHVGLFLDKHLVRTIISRSRTKVIIISGTNGKTTTGRMLSLILQKNGSSVIQNVSGANLLNGIASTLIRHGLLSGKIKEAYAIFEVDEYNVPLLLQEITPDAIIILNLFRDQLDRYGELDSIVTRWQEAFKTLSTTQFILNGDDPLIAYLGETLRSKKKHIFYFGLNEITTHRILSHAADSIYCPKCHSKLTYSKVYYSHLGSWRCSVCGLTRPKPFYDFDFYPLPGTYNKYNTLAAVTYARLEHMSKILIREGLKDLTPAFGRQELIQYKNKKLQIFLSKNPTSFNESLKTIQGLGAKTILLILNDRIPDGRDVSWIWDVDFENFVSYFEKIVVSGDRVWDMGLRLQYAQKQNALSPNIILEPSLESAIERASVDLKSKETLYILPTYSAMLEVRNTVIGRKLL